MIHENGKLKKHHPYGSTPITWPFVIKGISFWQKKEGLKQVYLLGNPIAWWIAATGPFLYLIIWIIDRLFLQRGIDDMGPAVRNWWDRSLGFLTLTWAFHWLPFFLMDRMLFLHHYLPAYIFSVIQTVTFIDFIGRDFGRLLYSLGPKTRMKQWRYGSGNWIFTIFCISLTAGVLFGFYKFMPICYGLGFKSKEAIQSLKWFPTWNFQYA
jgi:dolichyl-phosphate-mannose-protein mannosyltransferase